jgi:DNA-directed RNA polymerase specialized sigma24 family protein
VRRRQKPFLSVEDADVVRRVLYLNGLRGPDIEDGVQEVEVRALQRLSGGVRSKRAWACVVASNFAIDQLRRADRTRRVGSVLAERTHVGDDADLRGAVMAASGQTSRPRSAHMTRSSASTAPRQLMPGP